MIHPREQANLIYDLIGTYGADTTKQLHGKNWEGVIGVYQGMVTSGFAGPAGSEMREHVITAMEDEIRKVRKM